MRARIVHASSPAIRKPSVTNPHCEHGSEPYEHAAPQRATPAPQIGKTAPMNLDRHPFVASACDDIAENRTRRLTAAELLHPQQLPEQFDVNLAEEHHVTETFLSLWNNLSETNKTPRGLLLSLMHGITIETRHPAYRVSPTGLPDVSQAQVGDNATLVFRAASDPHQPIVWLAVIHGH